jgi:CBS domain-containing protein
MQNTKVKDLMTYDPVFAAPDDTLRQAAAKMKDVECGILPVGTKDKLQGIITDRDIVIRAIAKGKDPAKEKVKDYMSPQVYACNEEDYLEDAADKMRQNEVSRLVVKTKTGKISGILSFGGILRKNANAEEVANVVKHATHRAAA